ncbi:MAG: serine/threonine-protein kinase, partial [Planctomycetota bacterium]
MTPEQMQRAYELFEQALQRPPEERAAFLVEACGDYAELRAEVDSLLKHDSQATDVFMRPPGPDPAARLAAEHEPAVFIEGYEILSEVHRGGQGVVYKAVQKATKRTVALKVLLEGPYASPRQRHRFEREIDLVASLQHPNIVTIYDSGVTRDGRHYFAMEYIRGLPLNAYLSDKNPSIDATLRLFRAICAAVNYAHQRGVIHRDLKPANIRVDSLGQPHILDFGLAKIGGADLSLGAPMTVTGEFMGTLAYASPEQAKGDPTLIDIRTDVYSLGVILYEMLTSKYPYPVVGQMVEVLRNIAEAEPSKPSTIRRQINDEVETIVLKCLQKERERRYQSAGELARDVEHFLTGE